MIPPRPLAYCAGRRQIKNALNVSVNDVLMSSLAGALRQAVGKDSKGRPLGDMLMNVPISVRQEAKLGVLNNEFSLVWVSLPVSIADPLERIREMKRVRGARGVPTAVLTAGAAHGRAEDVCRSGTPGGALVGLRLSARRGAVRQLPHLQGARLRAHARGALPLRHSRCVGAGAQTLTDLNAGGPQAQRRRVC
jgi:hypothetical protein